MKITWLGQAGLLFEWAGVSVLIDPYLSDSVAKTEPQNHRRTPIDERFLRIKPDVIVITHAHGDHFDEETLCRYLTADSEITVLSPYSVWTKIRKFGGVKNNYLLFDNGTTWTEKGIAFRAVKAVHSDEYAIGVILTADEKRYYVTGDTLYSEMVFESLPKGFVEMTFLPVNGKGNNMNFEDGARFCHRIKTAYAVPIHIGTFDDLSAESFPFERKIIPILYGEIEN